MSVSNMSAFTSATPAAATFSPKAALAPSLFWRIVHWPAKVMEARATMRALASMSEHELRDIGLSQQDVADASALALDADPSRLFAERAGMRRGRRI